MQWCPSIAEWRRKLPFGRGERSGHQFSRQKHSKVGHTDFNQNDAQEAFISKSIQQTSFWPSATARRLTSGTVHTRWSLQFSTRRLSYDWKVRFPCWIFHLQLIFNWVTWKIVTNIIMWNIWKSFEWNFWEKGIFGAEFSIKDYNFRQFISFKFIWFKNPFLCSKISFCRHFHSKRLKNSSLNFYCCFSTWIDSHSKNDFFPF